MKGEKKTCFLIVEPYEVRNVIWNSYYEKEEFDNRYGENEFKVTRAYTNKRRLTFIFLVPADVLWRLRLLDVYIKDEDTTEDKKETFVDSLG